MKWLYGNIVLWVVGAFLIFVIFSAARIGAADLLSGYARDEMDAWSSSATRPDSSVMADVSRALGVARWIAPGNPDLYEDMARLALVRSGMPDINNAERNTTLREGLTLIRQAIVLRPVSTNSWGILLRLKKELGEYDTEFRRGLERAVTLGPWEPELQPVVAEAGLSAWAVLPVAEREMVRMNFVRGMKRQADTMISIAQSHRDNCNGERTNMGCRQ